MKQFKDYDKTQTMGSGSNQLPVGGYVCVVKDTQYKEYDWGDCLYIAFDIAEGDQKGFYMNKFNADQSEDKKWKGVYKLFVPKDDGSEKDEWTKRKFKTFTTALEESNKDYAWDWDEKKWKSKKLKFGAVMQQHETYIEGSEHTITFTDVAYVTSVQKIKDGDFKPADKYVDKRAKDFLATQNTTEFLSASEGPDEIPF